MTRTGTQTEWSGQAHPGRADQWIDAIPTLAFWIILTVQMPLKGLCVRSITLTLALLEMVESFRGGAWEDLGGH